MEGLVYELHPSVGTALGIYSQRGLVMNAEMRKQWLKMLKFSHRPNEWYNRDEDDWHCRNETPKLAKRLQAPPKRIRLVLREG